MFHEMKVLCVCHMAQIKDQPNSAYEFDGIDDHVFQDSIIELANKTAVSISAWFCVDTIESNNRFCGVSFEKKILVF